MLRNFGFEQAAEILKLDETELRFLLHHFWEFLSQPGNDRDSRSFTAADVALLNRVVTLQKDEKMGFPLIHQTLRQEIGAMQVGGRRQAELLGFASSRPSAGNSSVVFNLAAALALRGFRCTIFDASVASGGVEKLVEPGLETPDWNRSLPSGVRIVSGIRLLQLASPEDGSFPEDIMAELRRLDSGSDFILIDTGVGCSDNALRFASVVDETVMVTTTDVGVNADCFSVVRMLRDVDPDLPISIIVNRAASLGAAREAFARINGAGRKVDMPEVPALGWIIEDDSLRRCIAAGEAVVDSLATSPSSQCILRVADALTNRLTPAERPCAATLYDVVRALGNALQRGAMVRGV